MYRARALWQKSEGECKICRRRRRIEEVNLIVLNVFQTELIDGEACYIDVGFSYPGCAENFDAVYCIDLL